jgi:hypothetical protein
MENMSCSEALTSLNRPLDGLWEALFFENLAKMASKPKNLDELKQHKETKETT